MTATFVDKTGDGNATKSFAIRSLQKSDIHVKVNGQPQTQGTHYNITNYTTTGGGDVVFVDNSSSGGANHIPASGNIHIFRDTDLDPAKATYQAGSAVKADDLNNNQKQALYALEELKNSTDVQVTVGGTAPASGNSSGDLWWNNTNGHLYVFYDDGVGDPSNQWVAVTGTNLSGIGGGGGGSGGGTLTAVTGTAPIVSSGGNTPAISITAATTSAAGSMSAADKTQLATNTTKLATLSIGTISASSPSSGQVLKYNGTAWVPDTDATGGSGGGATNLTFTANGTSLTIESSSGNNASLPAATTSAWGVMTDDDKTNLDANTAKVTNATHTGEVTGSTALTIADNVVDEANLKVSNSPVNGYFLQAQSADTGGLTWAAAPTGSGGGSSTTSGITYTNSGTGASAVNLNTKLQETTSVKDYGATGNGSTDDSTAFSNAVKAAPALVNIDGVEGTNIGRAEMCQVIVPPGTYNIANVVDTNNRQVLYIIDQAAKFTTGSNAKLNGELLRPGQFNINTYKHGSTDYSTTYAIRANVGASSGLGGGDGTNAEVLGVATIGELATYQDRDSVALYVDNENAQALLNVSSVSGYTSTSVTMSSAPSADVLKRYRKGMIIDTKHGTPWVGVVDSWSANGQVINVQGGWYQYNSPSSTSTPTGTTGFAIGFKKVWAMNANVHLYASGFAEKACGFELGVRNYKSDSSNEIPTVTNRVWGFDAINLGGSTGKMGQAAFIARVSHANAGWNTGFAAWETTTGFTAYNVVDNGFQSKDSSGNVYYRVDNGGSLQLGQNQASSAVNRFIDFHSSTYDNDYDTRILSEGGESNDGRGIMSIIAQDIKLYGRSLSIGDKTDSSTASSHIDFHSSGSDHDFDARIQSQGGGTGGTAADIGMGNLYIDAANVLINKRALTVGLPNASGNNTALSPLVDSHIDFHGSGFDNDFDGRISFMGGASAVGDSDFKVYAKRFAFIKGAPNNTSTGYTEVQQWGILEDAGFYWLGQVSANSTSTSIHPGVIMANGYATKAGIGASAAFNNAFNIHWTGSASNLYIDTTLQGTITVSSDYRVKKDITSQTALGIDKVKQLRPVNYEFADNADFNFVGDGVKREGFIAHEVAEVIPSAVDGAKDAPNQIQSLRVDAIVSVLTKALQEAVAKIEVLETKVAALEAE
tara:strand:+ start:10084 stop:13566 length:3483 start_codon:yes stop_codon:yes gene_type:complete